MQRLFLRGMNSEADGSIWKYLGLLAGEAGMLVGIFDISYATWAVLGV